MKTKPYTPDDGFNLKQIRIHYSSDPIHFYNSNSIVRLIFHRNFHQYSYKDTNSYEPIT